VGPSQFVFEAITQKAISPRKLITAFELNPVLLDMLNRPETSYYALLGLAISKALARRERLPDYRTIDDAAKLLQKSSNIMVITGAGVSVLPCVAYRYINDQTEAI
jgi:NAD+-dependent protein deacetylase SIR2